MNKKTKLSVFDFDGTLIDTALPENGKMEYKNKTGKDWPHKGWWGQADSLDTTVFEMPVIASTIADYKEEKAKDDTLVVMLTGRLEKLAPYVKDILDANDLFFDGYYYNTGGSTDDSKKKTLESILNIHPSIEEITLWDDRTSHIPIFEEWGKKQCLSGRLKDFKINVVVSNHHQ